MFVQTELTPNDNALKFLTGVSISSLPKHFSSAQEAKNISSLAVRIFEITGVEAVFLGQDFITITKKSEYDWSDLVEKVSIVITEHLANNLPIIENNLTNESQNHYSTIDQKIIEILEHKVRPAVAMDGGDIEFSSFEDGVVKLILKGACGGCPSAQVTLKDGVESLLKYYVPEVKQVESV